MENWREVLTPFIIFIGATVLAFIWGKRRGEDPEKTLQLKLLEKAVGKVEKHLQSNPFITLAQMEQMLRGMQVRDAWFRKNMRIDDPQLYAKGLVRYMLDKGLIEYAGKNGYAKKAKTEKQ